MRKANTTGETLGKRKPLWEGPYSNGPEGGITQTLLAKWFVCPHRFWLQAICGAVDPRDFDIPILYGDAFHNALETYALGRVDPTKAGQRIKDYFHRMGEADPNVVHKAGYWSRIGYDQFLAYCDTWKEQDAKLASVAEEQSFCIPYTLPSGRIVYLRGKMDGIVSSGKGLYLFEHKVKGDVDEINLIDTLAQNNQAMFYIPAANALAKEQNIGQIDGLLYNVIRRPLAGGKGSIKQKKGRKVKDKKTGLTEIKGAETQEAFLIRLAGLYKELPDEFFYRWKVAISPDEVARYQRESLNPILERMCDWWDSIQGDTFDPWNTVKAMSNTQCLNPGGNPVGALKYVTPNKLHYRTPFGLYNKLAKGLVGDYQAYLTKGDKSSLKTVKTLFPELA